MPHEMRHEILLSVCAELYPAIDAVAHDIRVRPHFSCHFLRHEQRQNRLQEGILPEDARHGAEAQGVEDDGDPEVGFVFLEAVEGFAEVQLGCDVEGCVCEPFVQVERLVLALGELVEEDGGVVLQDGFLGAHGFLGECGREDASVALVLGGVGCEERLGVVLVKLHRVASPFCFAWAMAEDVGPGEGAVDGEDVGAYAHDGTVVGVVEGCTAGPCSFVGALVEEREVGGGMEPGSWDFAERVDEEAMDDYGEAVKDELYSELADSQRGREWAYQSNRDIRYHPY